MSGRRCRLAIGLVGLVLSGCRVDDRVIYPPRAGESVVDLMVLDNHWHTALIVRPQDLPDALRADLRDAARHDYVAIGWGDEGFFRATHITPDVIAQALFYSHGSVLLAAGIDGPPEFAFAPGVDVYRVPVTAASLGRVVDFASASFCREGGHVVDAGPGIDGGRFFTAKGRYAFYHTCNQWTADALAAGGLPISAAYTETAGVLAFQLRQLSGVRRDGVALSPPRPLDASALRWTRGQRP